ncbi:carbohydrate ABC transporter permease [Actinomadura rudentiformis]|uniref:carbohydrate ABC transporter permease n=1 Tax=Actinomadura rudentiformis TaxID=359158 RepID=UPI00178C242E|nr:sugar ABC transporter permease [Actinomadura rudentiformis]
MVATRAGTGHPRTRKRALKKRTLKKALRAYWRQYLAISPFYVLFAVFMLGPVLFSLFLAFHKWDGLGPMEFVGLQNFRFMVKDSLFWQSLTNTFAIWFLSTIPMLLLALVLAAMLNSSVRFGGFYRVAYFIPNVTSIVAIAIFFGSVFANQVGLVNVVLQWLHVGTVGWLTDSFAIKLVISALITWQWTGYNAIIYLAGMQAISSELYEAARIDGAGPVKCFLKITLPLLRPVILFTVIMSAIGGMQTFTEPQVLFGTVDATNPDTGGPGHAGLTTVLYLYREAFNFNQLGYGAAIAWALFLVILLFTVINWRLIAGSGRRDR